MSKTESRNVRVDEVIIHEMAKLHRLMTEPEYVSLLMSIEETGQLIPAIFYRGKLVDGRHRLKALKELGIEYIKIVDLPNNLTRDEVIDKVMASEVRRADTTAQKAIRAFRWIEAENGRTQGIASAKFAVPRPRISEAKRLSSLIGNDQLDKMYMQGYLYVGGQKHVQLSTIIKAIDMSRKESTEPSNMPEGIRELLAMIDTVIESGDTVSLAIIESYVKKARQQAD